MSDTVVIHRKGTMDHRGVVTYPGSTVYEKRAVVEWRHKVIEMPSGDGVVSRALVHLIAPFDAAAPEDEIELPGGMRRRIITVGTVTELGCIMIEA